MDDPANFDPRPREVHEQAKRKARGAKIVQALGFMNRVKPTRDFEFDDQCALDKQVGEVFTYDGALVGYGHRSLLDYRKALSTKLHGERILIDLLQEPAAEPVAYTERRSDCAFR